MNADALYLAMPDRSEITPVDEGCANGCNAPFGVRCSVCNTEKRQPLILCQCANHHRWFGWSNVVNVCLTCSGAAVNEYVMPARRSGDVGDALDGVLQAHLSVECCCSVEDGGTYCGTGQFLPSDREQAVNGGTTDE